MNALTTASQYADLIKPEWAPPSWLFGPVWTMLYIIITVTFGYVVFKWWRGEIDFRIVLPFLLNLIFNFVFTPLQFKLMSMPLATLDILLVLCTLIWAMKRVWGKYRWIALANIPYLMWVSFATVLQITIAYLNR